MESKTENQSLIERLFNAGAHFGFSKSRRHPTVKPYLYGNKQGTDIFDLEKTSALLEEVKEVLHTFGKEGKTVLFVATKDEVSQIVNQEAKRAEVPYVTNRWIGGMLTNFGEIKKRINRLMTLTQEGESGELERKYTKKERVVIGRELEKLTFNFDGIKNLERAPQALLIVDPRHDAIALQEALDMQIPVIGVLSSDNDLSKITYPIVVNDALQSSISLVMKELTDAYIAGKSEYVPKPNRTTSASGRRNTVR